jgi:hypothetical protein
MLAYRVMRECEGVRTSLQTTHFLPLPLFDIPLSHNGRDCFARFTSHFVFFSLLKFAFEFKMQLKLYVRSGSGLDINEVLRGYVARRKL